MSTEPSRPRFTWPLAFTLVALAALLIGAWLISLPLRAVDGTGKHLADKLAAWFERRPDQLQVQFGQGALRSDPRLIALETVAQVRGTFHGSKYDLSEMSAVIKDRAGLGRIHAQLLYPVTIRFTTRLDLIRFEEGQAVDGIPLLRVLIPDPVAEISSPAFDQTSFTLEIDSGSCDLEDAQRLLKDSWQQIAPKLPASPYVTQLRPLARAQATQSVQDLLRKAGILRPVEIVFVGPDGQPALLKDLPRGAGEIRAPAPFVIGR
jgi:hypothetical protein